MATNRILAEIKDLDDAKAAWDLFFGRFLSRELPGDVTADFDPNTWEFKPISVEFNPEIRQFKPRKDENAKYNPPNNFTGRTDHSDDFDDFLNGNTITIPEEIQFNEKQQKLELNKEQLNVVEKAIENGDFLSPVFKTLDHIYYALWLFKQNKITRQQMGTILARWQLNAKRTYRILDEKGNFTVEAQRLLLPIIRKNSFPKFTADHKERFRLLIQAAPKSEQVFYLSGRIHSLDYSDDGPELLLEKLQSWYRVSIDKNFFRDLHLSFGAMEAWRIAQYGIYGAAANPPFIGTVSIDTIKRGVQYYSRPTAVCIPKSNGTYTTQKIHSFKKAPMPVATSHDTYHANLLNTIPPEFNLMLNEMSEIIIKHTKPHRNWSKFLWDSTDREYRYFLYRSKKFPDQNIELTIDNGARLFEKMFSKTRTIIPIRFPLLNNQLTDEGMAIIFDMVKDQEKWMNMYKIDIDKLSGPYKFYINKMREFIKIVGKIEAYDLDLMSNNLKKNIIEFNCNKKKGLEYRVIGLDNEVKNGVIPWEKLPGFPMTNDEVLSNKKKLLPEILKHTSSVSHTKVNVHVKCSPEFFNLKFRLYCKTKTHKGFYKTDSHVINLIKDIGNQCFFKDNLKFSKIKKAGKDKNHTVLEYSHGNSKFEVNANNLDKFIPLLIKNKLSNGNINAELIRNQLKEIIITFKSIHSNNDLTDDVIDKSINKFSSLEEKLCFLENCIEQIKLSKAYHRNPTIDKLFSFLRPFITSSQQQHISQIHSKIFDVIKDHSKDMDEEKYEEFLWQLENRNPALKIYSYLPRTLQSTMQYLNKNVS